MFTKTLVLAALSAGFVAAFCPPCQQTSQQEAYQKADFIAHVQVNSVQGGGLSGGGVSGGASSSSGSMRHMRQMNAGGSQASASLPQQEPVTYQVNVVKSFKGGADGQKMTVKTSGDITCSGVRMLANQGYLIAGKRDGQSIEITKCGSIPLTSSGIPNGPILWTIAENNQQFSQGLNDGFKNSGSQQQAGGMTGALGGLQQPNAAPGAAAGMPSSMGQQQSGSQFGAQSGPQGSQFGAQSGSQGSQFGAQSGSQQGSQDSQMGQQSQGGQDSQMGQQSQGGQDSQQQGGQDSQLSQGSQNSQESQQQQGSQDPSQQQLSAGQQPQTEEEKKLQQEADKQAQQTQQASSRGMHMQSRNMQMRRW